MKKAILPILLMLLPLMAKADDSGLFGDNLDYTYDTLHKILTVYGKGPMKDYPYDHSPWSVFRNEIQTIIIKDGVTSIGNNAFYECRAVTSITIPGSVTSIGESALYGCSALTSITIPSSVTSISREAFQGTAWYNNLPDGLVYAGKVVYKYKGDMPDNTHVIIQEGTTEISGDAFKGCSGLISVTIPNSVTSIGEFAFLDCSALNSITIPNSVTSIGRDAFYGTAWYNNQPGGLVYAGKVAYEYKGVMPENTHITIQEGTLEIADFAFYGCFGLSSVTIPNGVTNIGRETFAGCWALTSANIPSSVASIGRSAFHGCSALTSVTIPNSLSSIAPYVFYGCSALTSITIPSSVIGIGDYAFCGCKELSELIIPNNIKAIGYGTFSGCEGLETLNIPKSLTSIGEKAFGGCNGLKSLYIPATLTSIGSGTFSGCNGLASITVDNGNMIYDSRDNCNAIIETATNTLLIGCNNSTIPNSIQVIGDYAFQNCKELKTILIPETVKQIGGYAFSGSGLTTIDIPNSVKWIFSGAFMDCENLTSIILPNSITTIMHNTFSGCISLSSIEMPETVTSIESSAFHSCKGLNKITVPQNVTTIGGYAFEECISLSSIVLPPNIKDIYKFNVYSALSDLYCFAEDVPNVTPNLYLPYSNNSTLHVPAVSIEKYKNAPSWNNFGNIVALTEEELTIYGVDTPDYTLSNSIEGIYMTQPDSYRIYKGNNQPYGNPYEITIIDNGDGTYFVDDLFGGWYSQRAGFSSNYSMTGNIEIKTNGIVSLKDSYVKGWGDSLGDSLAGLSGSYDTERKSFTIEADYVEGMHFYQTWVKVGDIFTVDGITYGMTGYSTASLRRGKEPFSGDINIPENVSYNGETYTVTSIDIAFSGCENLKSLTIPNSVKSISGAFNECTALKSVNIPNSVTIIEKNDFLNCTSLETVDIPNSVTLIGKDAFADCVKLSDLTLSDGLITIGNNAFSYCNGLKKLIIPKSVIRIGDYAFTMCEDIESISVDKDNLKYDSRGNCNAIIETYTNRLILGCKNTVIPQDVAIIGKSAFAGCYDLKLLDIPGSVTVIENGAFSGCTGLSSINLGNNIREIGDWAFYGCNRVKTLIIPQKVNAINSRTFEHCYDLRDFYCYSEAYPSTKTDAFFETPIENATLHVPANLIDTYRYTVPWSGFGKIVALTDNDPKPGDMKCGDINGDGVVNAADIVSVINIIKRGATEADISIADLNGDGVINKDDVEEIVKIIFANKK